MGTRPNIADDPETAARKESDDVIHHSRADRR
jgi:hypothetical protein